MDQFQSARDPQSADKSPPGVPWSSRDLLWSVALGAAVMFVLVSVLTAFFALIADATGSNQWRYLGSGLVLVSELGLLLPVWWFGVRKHSTSWRSVGFRGFEPARAVRLGCLSLLASFAFSAGWAVLLGVYGRRVQPDVLPLFGGGGEGLLLALLVGAVAAPIAEEAFFRGYLFAGLRQHVGRRRAALLSAGIFALAHILPTSWPPIFVLGLLFALLYDQTGSIWPAVLTHATVNAMGLFASYLLSLQAV